MITVNSNNVEIQLTAEDLQFVNDIQDKVTSYGQIPYDVPMKLIVGVIRTSARMFYRMGYYKSQQKAFYFLPKSEIYRFGTNTDNQIKSISTDPTREPSHNFQGYIVQLPGFVSNVMEIHKTNQKSALTSMELIENIQTTQRTSPYGQSLMGINNSLYIIESADKMIEQQAFDSIFRSEIPISFNPATKSLIINQKVNVNLVLETICNVDIQHLYNDDLFIRHVYGTVKKELKRVIGGHTIELPGGASLNPDEICNNLEDTEKVEEILKAASGVGDIIMMRD